MKLFKFLLTGGFVTPFAGVWIEIVSRNRIPDGRKVTPFAGVWIEISSARTFYARCPVTPFAGVWIEIVVPGGTFG